MNIILGVDPIKPPLTGVGHYALRLVRGLRAHSAITNMRYFAGHRWQDDPEQGLSIGNATGRLRRRTPLKPLAVRVYSVLQEQVFAWQARNHRDWLVHGPNYALPPCRGPRVVTVHDLSHIHYPQFHPRERVAYLQDCLPRTLERATRVITVSEFVRRELIDLLGMDPQRVVAVSNGVDEAFRHYSAAELAPVLERYRLLGTPYLLAVATVEPRKNLDRLLDAYARLPVALRNRFPLVLAGPAGWHSEVLEARIEALERVGQVRRLGYVPQTDLPLLYAGAWAFAYPSLYEGFGLPVLEALACGVPTLTGNRASLPEVAGDAALLVNPESVEDLTCALERLLVDQTWRDEARQRGLARASRFSWDRCTEETVMVYRQAMADG